MNPIIIAVTVPLAAALALFTVWFIRKKDRAHIEKKIRKGEPPSGEKEINIYENVALRPSENGLKSEAVRLLFDYCRKNHGGRLDLVEKAERYGQLIRKEFSNLNFYEDCMFELGNIYFFEKFDFNKAAEIFSELMEKKPSSRWRAVCNLRTRLIESNVSNPEALKLYVNAEKYFENSRFNDAEFYLNKIIKEFPGSYLAGISLFFLGDIYYYKHDAAKKALHFYRRLFREFPEHRSAEKAMYKTGEILRKKQKWEEAVELYREFSKQYPDSPYRDDAFFYIGECYQNMGMPRDAKNAYSLILGDYPDSKWTDVIYHRVQELNSKIEAE